MDLYIYFIGEKEKNQGRRIPRSTYFMYNKIMSILDQMDIIRIEE